MNTSLAWLFVGIFMVVTAFATVEYDKSVNGPPDILFKGGIFVIVIASAHIVYKSLL